LEIEMERREFRGRGPSDRPASGAGDRLKRYTKFSKHMRCRFCREKIVVDFKDVATLVKLCSPQGKVLARRKTGNCAKHQRSVSEAIKRARYMALLPYVTTGIV
jgi:small subunit ribosomal protein S18